MLIRYHPHRQPDANIPNVSHYLAYSYAKQRRERFRGLMSNGLPLELAEVMVYGGYEIPEELRK
jgi:hypothetical protein